MGNGGTRVRGVYAFWKTSPPDPLSIEMARGRGAKMHPRYLPCGNRYPAGIRRCPVGIRAVQSGNRRENVRRNTPVSGGERCRDDD